jgi:3-hydroxyacyl-CoA dehydrogenase
MTYRGRATRSTGRAQLHGARRWQTEPPFSVGANLKKTPAGGAKPSQPSAVGRLFRQFRREAESLALKAARSTGRRPADGGQAGEVERLVEQFRTQRRR